MRIVDRLLNLLFPPKCVLCRKILEKNETDLCQSCRIDAPDFPGKGREVPFLENWTAVWRYEGDARGSLIRFKFYNARYYADAYGRFLAMRLTRDGLDDFDVLPWVPAGKKRLRERGYDQCALLAAAVGRELNVQPVRLLKKVRTNRRQSGVAGEEARKANVLGAYAVISPDAVAGKRVLLLDDIMTTGATVSECAKVLMTAKAKEVYGAVVAAASHNGK